MTLAPAAAKAPAIPILDFNLIDSTNAEARRRAEAGETGPLWITARRQTAGRGRRDRAWETGPGNLAATLLTSISKPPAEAAQIAFVAALAVAELATTQVPQSLITLKWPNDVLVDGRKASGILVESGSDPSGRRWLAVGVGVNLASAPLAADRPSTTLTDHLRPDRDRVAGPTQALETLSAAFARWMTVWETFGFPPIRDAWTERAHGLGQACTARLDHEEVVGIAEGLDADGALRLRLPNGSLRRITAGDVMFTSPHDRPPLGLA